MFFPFYGGEIAQRNKVISPRASSQKTWHSTQGILFQLHILSTVTFGLSAALEDSGLGFLFVLFVCSFIASLSKYLLSDHSVSDAHLGAGDTLVSNPDKASALMERAF